jgi:hypothetical protein
MPEPIRPKPICAIVCSLMFTENSYLHSCTLATIPWPQCWTTETLSALLSFAIRCCPTILLRRVIDLTSSFIMDCLARDKPHPMPPVPKRAIISDEPSRVPIVRAMIFPGVIELPNVSGRIAAGRPYPADENTRLHESGRSPNRLGARTHDCSSPTV